MTTTPATPHQPANTTPPTVPPFAVISGTQVHQALRGREKQIIELIATTYRLHSAGNSVNPPSCFLRFPDRPTARIIALPASLGGHLRVDGLKWISSFPTNVTAGLPRASAVLILNDHDTGYPFACLESSIISATRTAASAALAAHWLTRTKPHPTHIGFVGTGLIARYIHTYLTTTGWTFDEIGVHDLSTNSATSFHNYLKQSATTSRIKIHHSAEQLIRASHLIIFATVATEPHINELSWFDHNPSILHVSLRDLAPQIVLASVNIVDDIEHCLKANTSLHLTEQLTDNRNFLHGTLDDIITGQTTIPTNKPVIFSPFGLGVLDLAVGKYVYDEVARTNNLHIIDNFFHELRRYG
jgi:N-[(2S)-2-amino-2-carboxyethyl]-L-glutamate dehydrogenase